MLLNTISTILCPLVKLMKGALDYMDTLHVEPWIKGSKKNYTMNKMLSSLSDESFLNFLSPSVIHSSTIENKLITIKKFFYIRRKELNIDMNFCHFKDPIDFISDIQILNNEYENLKTKENEKFYHFLRIKIENEAQWTIKNRYIDLGFQYKINTYETFIPSLQEQKKPKVNIILSEDLSKTLPHDNTEKETNIILSEDLSKTLPHDNTEKEMNIILSEDLFKTLPSHDNIEQEINKIPSEDLSESLLHDNIEEEMNKIPPKDLPESLLHDNIEEEEENLEDILLEIPNEFLPINMYL
ncbi:uncharacterized protein LOC126900971 isoform X4 [Daktulosphaira vitifoliae]|uniref:uncharacterized protein LOC126900971 isoform X4 n=1 Tax=Daktulosphaira vitifoliae TaxID=58002 RepID=UPI0021AAA055|nr:uncharacterized protein LOC126900971 isoform X4 [Daktulosphaira vitifoliae]